MVEVYVVTYFSGNECHRCVCGLDCKRAATTLARTKSKESGHYSQVWRSKGFWDNDTFHDVESVNVAIYENGKRR